MGASVGPFSFQNERQVITYHDVKRSAVIEVVIHYCDMHEQWEFEQDRPKQSKALLANE